MNKKYSHNENYFSKIDTEAKAYFLGLLYADGNVRYQKKNNSWTLTLNLQARDKHILNTFLQELNGNQILYMRLPKKSTHQLQYSLTICSKKICNDLIKLGCVPCKSLILKWPTLKQVPKKFIRHFIRGYFDGDGYVSIQRVKHTKVRQFHGGFLGTRKFCEGLNKVLYDYGVSKKLKKISKKNNIFYYSFGGNRLIERLFYFLYHQANFFLFRKEELMAKAGLSRLEVRKYIFTKN